VQLAELVRKATVYVTGTAAMKLMTELEKEQETLTLLSDMCIDAYTIDSVVRRAIQAQTETSPAKAALHANLAKVAAHAIYERASRHGAWSWSCYRTRISTRASWSSSASIFMKRSRWFR